MEGEQKLCCKWQGLIFECMRQRNFQEFYKVFEGWSKSGKITEDGSKVVWDCKDCNKTYSVLGAGGDLNDFTIKRFQQIGCCRTIPMIRNLDDKVDVNRLGFWMISFKDIMCSDCNEIAKQATIESGLMKTIIKIMDEEEKRKDEKVWREFVMKGPEVVISEIKYFEYLQAKKKEPTKLFELWDEMKQNGYSWWNPNRIEIKRFLFHKATGNLNCKCDEECSFQKKIKEGLIT